MPRSLYISSFSRVLKAVLFAVTMATLVCAALLQIGKLYSSATDKNMINENSNRRFDDFYALAPNTLDMVFVGSSHSYCTFDPENFDSALGTSSYQLGMPLQQYDATYYTVMEMYNYQTPSVVVVEVYWDLLGKDVDLKQALTLFNSLKNPELERRFVNDVFNFPQRIKYNTDIFNYQKDYFTYKSTELAKKLRALLNVPETADFRQKQQGEEYYKGKGYVYCSYNMLPDEFGKTNQFNSLDGRSYEMNRKQAEYLKRLVELCREKGSEVLFVTAPVANVSLTKIKNYTFINEKVAAFARSQGVPYIDYNMEDVRGGMFTDESFRDDAHLNDSGVKILNAHFIDRLKQHTNL